MTERVTEDEALNVVDVVRDAIRPSPETVVDFALRLWWFWLLVAAFLLVRLVLYILRERRLARSGIYDEGVEDGACRDQRRPSDRVPQPGLARQPVVGAVSG